ncbi:hypothetical protein O9929_04450 [Vibrio lentus]|nr:hypothetical protein [Vibrio lentus]
MKPGMPLTTWHFGGDEAKNIKLGAGFFKMLMLKTKWHGKA